MTNKALYLFGTPDMMKLKANGYKNRKFSTSEATFWTEAWHMGKQDSKTDGHDHSSILPPVLRVGGGEEDKGGGEINKDPSLKPEALSRHRPLVPWRRWCPAAAPGTRQPWCPSTPDVLTPQSPQSSAAALCCPPAGWLLEHHTVTTGLLHDTDHRAVTWDTDQRAVAKRAVTQHTDHRAVTGHTDQRAVATGLLHDTPTKGLSHDTLTTKPIRLPRNEGLCWKVPHSHPQWLISLVKELSKQVSKSHILS